MVISHPKSAAPEPKPQAIMPEAVPLFFGNHFRDAAMPPVYTKLAPIPANPKKMHIGYNFDPVCQYLPIRLRPVLPQGRRKFLYRTCPSNNRLWTRKGHTCYESRNAACISALLHAGLALSISGTKKSPCILKTGYHCHTEYAGGQHYPWIIH